MSHEASFLRDLRLPLPAHIQGREEDNAAFVEEVNDKLVNEEYDVVQGR